jgi:hypothetical protein
MSHAVALPGPGGVLAGLFNMDRPIDAVRPIRGVGIGECAGSHKSTTVNAIGALVDMTVTPL